MAQGTRLAPCWVSDIDRNEDAIVLRIIMIGCGDLESLLSRWNLEKCGIESISWRSHGNLGRFYLGKGEVITSAFYKTFPSHGIEAAASGETKIDCLFYSLLELSTNTLSETMHRVWKLCASCYP